MMYNSLKKIKATAQLDVSNTAFKQINYTHSALNVSYNLLNFFLKANISYKINSSNAINFRYNGYTRQPTISQLQPMVINTNPTNIMIGNPNLKQEFRHSMSLSFNSYSELKGHYFYLSLSHSKTDNAITSTQNINESGIRTYQYINSKGADNTYLWGSGNIKLAKNLNLNLGMNLNYSNRYNFNNNIENLNSTFNIEPSLGFSYSKDTSIYISYSFNTSYYNNQTSIRTDLKQEYWNYKNRLYFSYLLPFSIQFRTDLEYNFRPNIDRNVSGREVCIWNASLSKRFTKKKMLEAKVYCYDILNQNVGYTYQPNGDMIYERSYNRIQQYFMASLILHFNSQNSSTNED